VGADAGALRAEATLAALPGFAVLVLVIVSVFALTAFAHGEATARERFLLTDGPTLVVALAVRFALQKKRVTARYAGVTAALLAVVVSLDTLGSFALFGGQVVLLHFILEVMVVGSMLPTLRVLLATYGVLGLGWVVLCAPTLAPADRVDYALATVAAAALGLAVFFARAKSDARMADLAGENARALHDLERELASRTRLEAEREELARNLAHAQKMEAVGTLAGGVAHDMNNVLMAIGGLAEVLRADLPPGPQREDASSILDASRRGASLTRNLLGFSRKGRYRSQPTDLAALVRQTAQLLSRTLPKDLVLVMDLPGAPVLVKGDESQLSHALLNVCLNAADAMPGGGRITISVRACDVDDSTGRRLDLAPGRQAVLEVRDEGPGMSEEVRQRAFEPFFTTKPVGKGTGLGLSMVYGTVTGHGGAVTIESVAGEGTCVSMLLPLLDAAAAAEVAVGSALVPAPADVVTRLPM
jgi:signal transduction histidine kinase